MQSRFLNRWGEVEKAIKNSIAIIKKEPPDPDVFKKLDEVGMTKEMLALETASLSGCVGGLYCEVNTGSPILSMKWLKPNDEVHEHNHVQSEQNNSRELK